jgi:hypothetical protein
MASRFQIARMKSAGIVPPTEEELHRIGLNMSESEYDRMQEKAEKCFLLAKKIAGEGFSQTYYIDNAASYMKMADEDYRSLCVRMGLDP